MSVVIAPWLVIPVWEPDVQIAASRIIIAIFAEKKHMMIHIKNVVWKYAINAIERRKKMGMRAIDVLRNLDSHEDVWDISGYKLSKAEAEVIIKALKLLIEKEDEIHADSEQGQQK